MQFLSVLIFAVLTSFTYAAVGGKCSGDDLAHACICLDQNICKRYIHGTPVSGKCPNSPNNVLGCYIYCT
jgi:hypothetical protein